MSFPSDFLDELRARLSLSGVVGRRVKLIRRGREFTGLCPFHNEKTPSFTVSDDKAFFHCFGCGEHGDIISFVQKTEGLSFLESVERLASEAGLSMPQQTPEAAAREKKRAGLIDVMSAAARWYQGRLRAKDGQEARHYLTSRGLSADTVEAFGLGYAPNQRGALTQALKAEGIGINQLLEGGLIKQPEEGGATRDFFFDRIIFPIKDRRGRIIAFGGRALGDSPAKYINSPDTPLFQKGRVLFNLDGARLAAQNKREILVTEGYMDVIALSQAGFPGAVAPLGTAVTEAQIEELWRLAAEPIMCLDGDRAGRQAAFRAADRALGLLRPGCSLQFTWLPQGEDPDSLIQGQGAGAMRALLEQARPLVDILWEKEVTGRPADTPERRAALRKALRQSVQSIPDPELKADYQREMMRRFGERFDRSGGSSQGSGQFKPHRPGQRPAWRGTDRGIDRGVGRGDLSPSAFSKAPYQAAAARLRRRQEQVLLAGLVNHPGLLVQMAEDLATVLFGSTDLDRLAAGMLNFAADQADKPSDTSNPMRNPQHLVDQKFDRDLDRETLRCHLSDQGFESTLQGLTNADVYTHGEFARPGASMEAARLGLLHLLSVMRERGEAAEARSERLEFESDMTEANLARMQAKQKISQESQTHRQDMDRYEAVKQSEPN
ncbi:MAG: DNA primase [Pseudomonadota bacterium]